MNKKFYITTSIPYVNSAPHLGNVLDPIYCDVLARYKAQHGFDVRFLTGGDEHGVKIVRAAEAAGITPQKLVDGNSAKFKALKEILNLSWNDFIRTSDQKRHWPGAKKIWEQIAKNEDIYKKTYKGFYCVGHEAFVTEKDLGPVRSSPPQGSSGPRLRAGATSNGMETLVCKDHQTIPEIVEEENWFFKLSKYSKEIYKQIINGRFKVVPETRKNEILSLLNEGLHDISISRPKKDLSWGVPLPNDKDHTIYVWAEALVTYISSLGYGSSDESQFEKYWPADVQVVGKDNLRFHAAIWPGILLAAGLPLPQALFVHGFITVDNQKVSKTVGNVIDPGELVKKYGIDPVRYYLLREVSPFEDGDFSYEKFEELYNGDLANGLGNFTARVLALGEKLGELKASSQDIDKEISNKIEATQKQLDEKLNGFKFHEAAATIWGLIHFGDAYINEKKPWEKGDDQQKAIINLIAILDSLSSLLQPFLPETAEKISSNISWQGDKLSVKKSEVLFPRLN